MQKGFGLASESGGCRQPVGFLQEGGGGDGRQPVFLQEGAEGAELNRR